MRVNTRGATEWLSTLKSYWNISYTKLIDHPEAFIVMHYGKSGNVMIGYYDRQSHNGYISCRRGDKRE